MSVFIRRWSGGATKLLLTGMTVVGLGITMAPSASAAVDAIATGNSPGAATDALVALCHEHNYSNTTVSATGHFIADDGRTYFFARGRCS